MASLIGREIGKYRITERIGRGGMAEVYEGVHTHLDRKVAIKVLHSHLLEGGDFVARFKREAKAVANLRHPNIVQVYDFDITDEMIFMVMEFIDGVNLHTMLVEAGKKKEHLPIKMIGSIINDIAGALDYAHSKGMLHRDIKPSNILVDKNGKAYLTDFGIAKLLEDKKFTATGQLMGTPAYMSPEQGKGEDLTEESDIYSLGVVAFEMLTGQVPYDAKTPIGIVHKQINDPIPNISSLVDGVPNNAQEVIDRALAKSPESRYSSAEALVAALRVALQALESPESIPIATPEDHPTVVDDGLEAPTVTMDAEELEQPTVLMESEKPPEEKKPEKKAEPEPAPKVPGEKKKIPVWAYIAGGALVLAVVGVILTQVLDLGGLGPSINPEETISSEEISQLTEEPEPEEEISQPAEEPEPEHEPTGEELYREAEELYHAGVYEDVLILLQRALDMGYEPVEVFQLMGQTLWRLDRCEEAIPFLQQAIELNPEAAWSYFTRGACRADHFRDYAGAVEDLERATELDPEVPDFWIVLGYSYYFANDQELLDKELDALNRAVELDPEGYEAYFWLGEILSNKYSDYGGALENLTIAIEHAPPDWPYNSRAFYSRGLVNLNLGDYIACVEDYSQALEIYPEDPLSLLNRGKCYRELDEPDLARADFKDFLVLTEGIPQYEDMRQEVDDLLASLK